jgi:hypothetical protein
MIQIEIQTANRLKKGSHSRTPGNPDAMPLWISTDKNAFLGSRSVSKWFDSNKNLCCYE